MQFRLRHSHLNKYFSNQFLTINQPETLLGIPVKS